MDINSGKILPTPAVQIGPPEPNLSNLKWKKILMKVFFLYLMANYAQYWCKFWEKVCVQEPRKSSVKKESGKKAA